MKIELEVTCTNEKVVSQLDSALEGIEDIKVEKFEQNGFDGLHILFYFLNTGTPFILIDRIYKIFIGFMHRNDVKSFKANGIEFVGYSEKETEKLLEKLKETYESKPEKSTKK